MSSAKDRMTAFVSQVQGVQESTRLSCQIPLVVAQGMYPDSKPFNYNMLMVHTRAHER